MASGVFTDNGTVGPFLVKSNNVHVGVNDTFGGGTVAVEKVVTNKTFPLYEDGSAITYTAAADSRLNVSRGDLIQLTLSGATSPNIVWSLTGMSG